MSENNKDKIKEILEGHNKKFTLTEIIVGVLVVLLVGVGVGYAIFKLLAPPPTPQLEYAVNNSEVVKQPNLQTSSTSSSNQQSTSEEVAQTKQPEAESNNSYASSNGTSNSSYGNSNVSESENGSVSENYSTENSGPQIITPSKMHKSQSSNSVKNNVSEKHLASTSLSSTNKFNKTKHSINSNRKNSVVHSSSSIKKRKHYFTSSPKNRRTYIIWVSSNSNRKFALLNVIKLRKCGHKAFSREVKVKGKIYTRVYVGPVKGYIVAKIEAKEIKKQLHLKYTPIIKKYDKIP